MVVSYVLRGKEQRGGQKSGGKKNAWTDNTLPPHIVHTLSEISLDVTLDCASVLMSSSSSRMLPWLLESMNRILSSMSFSSFFILALESWERKGGGGEVRASWFWRNTQSRELEVSPRPHRGHIPQAPVTIEKAHNRPCTHTPLAGS